MRRTTSRRKLRIAFGFPSGIALSERLQHGIVAYAAERGGWDFIRSPEALGTSLSWLRNCHGDGAFIFITSPREDRYARSLGLPAVNLSSHIASLGFPTVCTDHRAIGRMAADHFLARKFRRFAFYGTHGLHYMTERFEGFREALAGHDVEFQQLLVSLPSSANFRWRNEGLRLDRWLQKQTPPVAVFAGTDHRACMVISACARIGLRIPQDVALLGVDNDPLVCDYCEPRLSSISRNDFEVGRRAAALLEQKIQGASTPRWTLIPPSGVVERSSTDAVAIEDPIIAEAVAHIRSRIHQSFGAEEIAARAAISRRRFEARFRHNLGCSPYTFINNLRVERAKTFLAAKDKLSLTEIAGLCGFTSPRRFRLVFQRVTGQSLGQWTPTSAPAPKPGRPHRLTAREEVIAS